jgi:hypothetical protein
MNVGEIPPTPFTKGGNETPTTPDAFLIALR